MRGMKDTDKHWWGWGAQHWEIPTKVEGFLICRVLLCNFFLVDDCARILYCTGKMFAFPDKINPNNKNLKRQHFNLST